MKRMAILAALLLAGAPCPVLAQQNATAAATTPDVQFERLWLGSSCYPEQWPEERWA